MKGFFVAAGTRAASGGGAGAWLALLAGVAHTASFAPFGFWWLQPLALLPLLAQAWSAAPRRAAWLGACFGTGWLVSGLWWLHVSLHDFGGIPSVLAALAVLLLSAALSLYLAAALALWARGRTGRPVRDALRFAAWWLAAELVRAQWLTGFPWLASGYAHTEGPLAALAPWLGVYGIGACSAACAALGMALWRGERVHRRVVAGALALVLALPLAAALGPGDFTEPAGTLRVSLLQPNVPQDLKFNPEHIARNMDALRAQLRAAQGQLVLTPESVLPLAQHQLDPDYWADLIEPFQPGAAVPGRAALIGSFVGNDVDGYVNSLIGVRSDEPAVPGRFYAYGKRHLLPFGEYTPPGFQWLVTLMQIPLADQAAGRNEAPLHFAGQRIRPLICYEDLFGEDFAASTVGPQAATLLANASNFAWFGRWMVQDQHLQFSRMRALELQRPLVRATNTGATTVIDHRGQVTHRLPPWVRATLDAEIEGRLGATPYARWVAAVGLWPLWAAAALLLALARRRPPASA